MKTINILHIASFHALGWVENILYDFLKKREKGFNFHIFSRYPVTKYWKNQFQKS